MTINIDSQIRLKTDLDVNVFFRDLGKIPLYNKPIEFDKQINGRVMTLSFANKKGTFTIVLANRVGAYYDMVVVIPKPGLTELRAQSNIIGRQDTIYEIFIPEGQYAII